MKLLLVRHGETDFNINGTIQGQIDVDLNEKGIMQTKLLAERLKDEKIDIIYTSKLKRAIDTAIEIQKYHPNILIIQCSELNERHYGVYQGKQYALFDKLFEKKLKRYMFRPEGGENYSDVQNRAMKLVRKIIAEHKDKNVMICSHGGTNVFILCGLLDIPLKNAKVKQNNTCINEIEILKNGETVLYRVNDDGHLVKTV